MAVVYAQVLESGRGSRCWDVCDRSLRLHTRIPFKHTGQPFAHGALPQSFLIGMDREMHRKLLRRPPHPHLELRCEPPPLGRLCRLRTPKTDKLSEISGPSRLQSDLRYLLGSYVDPAVDR